MADHARDLIRHIVRERGLKLKALSIALGKSHAYLQQFLERGVPRKLPEDVRPKLAELLGIEESELGGPFKVDAAKRGTADPERALIHVPVHDARVSAGGGTMIDSDTEIGRWPFPRDYIRHTLSLRSPRLSVIEVIGDSMEPTLKSGDKLLIDLGDTNVALPGVFALHDGDGAVVKRIEKIPASDPISIALISDNPRHGRYEVTADRVNVIGRVVWFGRRL